MDGLVTMIVDILRRKKDEEALGPGVIKRSKPPILALPRAEQPKHGGRTYDEIVDEATGR